MNHTHSNNRPFLVVVLGLGLLATLGRLFAWPVGSVAAYVGLLLLPGLTTHLFIERKGGLLQFILSALVLSPLLLAALGTVLLLGGLSTQASANILLVATFVTALIASLRTTKWSIEGLTGQQLLLLAATLALFCAAAIYLPLRHIEWRYWSDAWFHAAVVNQIDTYGIPPEDPYFAGLDLQYMWIYHVLVLLVAKATGLGALFVMPLLNASALAGFGLSAYLLSVHYKKNFVHGWFALICVILALNAVIWIFLPVRIVRAFVGEIRGWDELARNFSIVPFDRKMVWEFLVVYYNQTFLLNKFIVSTAMSLGLMFMAAFWYACVTYLTRGRPIGLWTVFLTVVGMLTFHSLFGVVMVAGLGGGLVLLFLLRRHVELFSLRRSVTLAIAAGSACVASAPYLFSILHLKESDRLLPIQFMLSKTGGILISCALVIVLAALQLKTLWRSRSVSVYFLLFTTFAIVAIVNLIKLPASNTFDKLPFFVFYPLAIVGSWALADRFARLHATAKYRRKIAIITLALLLPVNAFAYFAYVATPIIPVVSSDEAQLSRWVGENTSRDALFFDTDDLVLLLVTGPRRYYWGKASYAFQWGYPESEMNKRRQIRDDLYAPTPLSITTLGALAALEDDVYAILRSDTVSAETIAKFRGDSLLFDHAFTAGTLMLFKINRDTCRERATQTSELM